MPVTIQLKLTIDQKGVSLTSSGKPHKMNAVEQGVTVALMNVIKQFLAEAGRQIDAAAKAQETAGAIVDMTKQVVEDKVGMEGVRRGVEDGPTAPADILRFPSTNGDGNESPSDS